MANKKYNEFPAGTYDATKLILQADPTTGALTKINLGNIPSTQVGIYGNGTLTKNIASTDTTLSTLTIPANTIQNEGDFIQIVFLGQSLNAAVNKQWKLQMDGSTTTLYNSSNTGIFLMIIDITYNRLNDTTIMKTINRSGVVSTTSTTAASNIDWTIDQAVTFIGYSTTANILEHWSTRVTLISQP